MIAKVTAIADRRWSKVRQPYGIIRGNGESDEFMLGCITPGCMAARRDLQCDRQCDDFRTLSGADQTQRTTQTRYSRGILERT